MFASKTLSLSTKLSLGLNLVITHLMQSLNLYIKVLHSDVKLGDLMTVRKPFEETISLLADSHI